MYAVALLAAAAVSSSLPADERLYPATLEVGQQGAFAPQTGNFYFEVVRVHDETRMVVRSDLNGRKSRPFVLKGLPTKGKADGSKVLLEGVFKVTGTQKTKAGGTLLVVEPKSKE